MSLLYLLGAIGTALLAFAAASGHRAEAAEGGAPGSPDPTLPPGDGGAGDDSPAGRGSGDAPPVMIPLRPPTLPVAPPPTTAAWSAAMAPLCLRFGIPLPYALRWMATESAGRPCACGNPAEKGPDGYPREMGIGQLYNPDDLDVVSPPLTSAELRAYCVPGDWHDVLYGKKIIRGFSQDQLRPLTPDEIQRQAAGHVGLIARCDQLATKRLAAVGAGGPGWLRETPGYWALVKMQHGYPVLARQALPAATKLLGRAPRDWRELADALPRAVPALAGIIPRILRNAEKTASAVPAPRSVA